jgi:hypothetical protein
MLNSFSQHIRESKLNTIKKNTTCSHKRKDAGLHKNARTLTRTRAHTHTHTDTHNAHKSMHTPKHMLMLAVNYCTARKSHIANQTVSNCCTKQLHAETHTHTHTPAHAHTRKSTINTRTRACTYTYRHTHTFKTRLFRQGGWLPLVWRPAHCGCHSWWLPHSSSHSWCLL